MICIILFAVPDDGSAYLAFDVKNELDEPIVVKWQQDGETKSVSVPAKATETKELAFDLAKPGALSPKIFKAFTKEGNQPVNINAKRTLTFTPSVEKKKENIVVSPNTEDSYTIIYVINNAKEDVEVAWKRGDINHVIRVPNEDKRYHEIVFDKRKGEVPLTFSAHSYRRGKDFKIALNSSDSHTFSPTLTKKVNTLIVGGKLKSADVTFVNNAEGPVVISWLEKGRDKTLQLGIGETIPKSIMRTGEDATKRLVFTARRTDVDMGVRLNDDSTAEFVPSVDTSGKTIIVTDIPRYVVAEFKNEAFSPVEVSWLEKGKERKLEIKPTKIAGIEVTLVSGAALEPLEIKGKYKKYDDPVLLNDAQSILLTPTVDKAKQSVVIKDAPKYVNVDLINKATVPVSFLWKETGKEQVIAVKPGDKKRQEIVLLGQEAYTPLEITAKTTGTDSPVHVNKRDNVFFTPSLSKPLNAVTATYKPNYIVASFINSAAAPIIVSWEKDGVKKTREVKPGETVQQELVFTDGDQKRQVTFTAVRKDINEPVQLNGAANVKFSVTPNKKPQMAIASDVPRYVLAAFTNNAAAPIVVSWKQEAETKTTEVKPGETDQKELVFIDGDPKRQVTFSAVRKDNNEQVTLNGAPNVKFTVTPDKTTQKAIANDIPRYIVAEFTNNAAGPIVVSWQQDGETKTTEVQPGKTIQQELVFIDGDPKRQVTFSAVRKDNNEPVTLNGAENVKFTASQDKKPQKAVAGDVPRYIVADFTNNAAGPIVVSWELDGEKTTREVKPGETVQQELVFTDGNPKREVTFTAVRKDNNEPVKLNGAENVKFTVTPDKKAQKAIGSDVPRYIVAEFTNNAAGPIIVSWEQDGKKETREVKPGETVKQELVFIDGDAKQQVTFSAVRKDNNEPVKLNGAENVKFTVTRDKKAQKAIASDIPRYIVAEFTNNAAGPIIVSWEQDGEKKTRDVKPGKTIQQELVFIDGDPKRQVTFSAVRKDNNEPVTLNGAENVKFTATSNKKAQKAVAVDVPKYIVADFTNNAAGPIVVSWQQDGGNKTREVKTGETVQQELVFTDGNPKREVTFTAVRKDNNEPVKLNGAENVNFTVTPDKKAQKAIGSDVPRYIVAEFTNNAAGPIIVSWEQDGKKETTAVKPGEAVKQELVFIDGDAKQQVTFSAVRKDNNEPVKLNGAENVKFTVTRDKKAQKAIASDIPRYIVAEFTNNAAGPIIVSWEQDGEKKTRDVKPGETVKQELVFIDGDSKQQVTFNAVRKENNEPVTLNGAENVKFTASPDKKPQKAVVGDVPRYIVADFTNNAAGPIIVSWEQDGKKETKEVKQGETVKQELVFIDGNPKQQVTFSAVRKDNNEPVTLNGAENVKFTVTTDKKPQKAVAGDVPRYIVADFTNNAAGPIVVSWELDGEKKTREVKPGETVQQELVFTDGNPKREVTFTAVRKDNNEPVKLNGAENVKFTVTPDKKAQKAIGSDVPRYIVAEFTNNAAGPIIVSWEQDGKKETRDVKPGETVTQELVFIDGDAKQQVTFSAVRKDNNEPVKLNGAENVKFTVTRDKTAQKAIASDIPRYIVAEFTNNAAGPIIVSWEQDGEKKTREVKPGETVKQELVFIDGDSKQQVTFNAVSKENNEPVTLNGAENVKFTASPDKKPQKAVAGDVPRYIVAEFTNNAAGPIIVSWEQDGEKKTRDVKPGKTIQQELVFIDGDPKRQVTFSAVRKDNNEPVTLNGAENVKFTATSNKKPQKAVAVDVPRYIVADFTNNAAGPIVVSWQQDGGKKTREVKTGETVQQELVFTDGNPKREVTFTAVRKDNNEPVKLNGAENVNFTVTPDKKAQKAIGSDVPRYIVAEFTNNAAGPIIVSWEQDGKKETRDVKPGETVKQELVFIDGDAKQQVTFSAVRKDNNEPVKLNGAENVKFTVTRDKKAQKAIASDIPRYIVAEFTNNAAGPIIVSWEQDAEKKTRDVKPGETVKQELVFIDGDSKQQVTFNAVRKENNEPVTLNGAENVKFTASPDKKPQKAVAGDVPRYIVADFTNNAAGPIIVSWEQDGKKETKEVKQGETVKQELVFIDGNPKRQVTFSAVRKDNNEPVTLNGAENVKFTASPDKKPQKAVAGDVPRYIVADFTNNAAGPIVVSWELDGEKKTREVKPGETVQQELVFTDGNPKREVTFTAVRKDNNEPVKLNGAENVKFTVTPDKKAQRAIGSDVPRYIVAEFTNNAAGPIIVSWEQDGKKETREVKPDETVKQELVFIDGDAKQKVTFSAVRKDNNEPVNLNGAENVKFTVTRDKKAQKAIASDIPRYIVAEFTNNAAGPIIVSWEQDGEKKTRDVKPGETVKQELVFIDGDSKQQVTFNAVRKENNEPVTLNGAENVKFTASPDKKPQKAVAGDVPRYIVADFTNNAAGPILVSWEQDGKKETREVKQGETVKQELVFIDGNPKQQVTFSAVRKDYNEPVTLNGAENVKFTVTTDKKPQKAVAGDVPRYIVADFTNNAAGPIVVSWELDGEKKTREVKPGETVQQELVFTDGNPKREVTFTAVRKDNNEPVKLNGAENVKFTVTPDKKAQKAIGSDVPRYIVAEFTNNAAGPIIVSWEQDGKKETRDVKPGETVTQELVFIDGDAKQQVTFSAVRKDNNEPVKLNGEENVKFTVTRDKKAQKAIASDIPRYIVAEFTNNAAGPIIVSWEQDGEKKTRDVKPGETVKQELVFIDGDSKQQVTFNAVRKENNEPVTLNGAEKVKFTASPDKKPQKAVAGDVPRYIVADFTNNAAGPIVVSWEHDGAKKTREVKLGETVQQELLFIDGDAKRQVTFSAVRKDNNELVTLNGAENVKFTVTTEKKPQKAVAGDVPRYIVADFTNNAAGPIFVSWELDGEKKTREVKPGETVQQELVFTDGNPKHEVTFTAVRKDNNEPVKLNGAENVKFTVTPDKKAQRAIGSDVPRYIVAEFTNNAAGPIIVSWEQDGKKETREVKPDETVKQELVFIDGDAKQKVTFSAVRKDNNEPVNLNGAENVKFTVTRDKKAQKAIASDIPRYIVAEFTNNAAGPIIVSWEQDGEKKTRDVKPGETVKQELVFIDGDSKQQVTFNAVRKENNEPVTLNGAENVKFTAGPDKKPQKAVAGDVPRYIVADFTNNAAGPILVSWEQDGKKETREVKQGETVKQELVFINGNPKQQVTFSAVRKDNNEPVTLNGAENVKFTVTTDKKPQKAVAGDVPRYIVADFTNNAAGPIVVSWELDGEKKTREVKPGETVQQELVFTDGNPKREVTFTAVRKDNNEPVKLNGAENVKFTVTPDKKAQKAIGSDVPRYIVAEFTSNAAGPIIVSWEQDGKKETRDVKPGETVTQELVFIDGDAKQQVTFSAVRKDNNEPVKLNGAENVKFTVTRDKKAQKAIASDIPRYIVAEFTNNAAGPIIVSWEQDGEKKTRDVKPGETVKQELVFIDGDSKQQVTFNAVRKENNEPVTLNGAEKVKFTASPDKKPQKAVAGDVPRYIVADFTNNAAGPIVVSWEHDGAKKTREVKLGETVQQELLFIDGDAKRQVTFSAVRKDNNEPVTLNGAENVKFTVTTDKKPQKAVAGDVPRYIVADFTNNAAGPIVVSWELDGEKKTREVKPGETVQQELVFTDGNPKREVTFTAVRKDNNEPVKLNGAENVKFTVTPDKKAQKAIGSDVPRYIVAEFTRNAAGPIIVSWEQDGKKETRDVKPGETVTQELVFIDGDAKQQVTFSAVRKDNNEPVKLNGAENVKFTVTRDKKAQKAIASDIPRYIVAEFTNNAAGPIIVSWEQDGEKKTRDVKPGETVKQELVFIDGDSKQQVTFNAVRKENNEPVTLNGAEKVKFTASPDKKPQKAVAGDVPRYIVADFTNNAAGPIVVSWEHDGAKKTREVKLGETVQQELLFIDGDAKRQVTFSAVRKDNNEPVTLNGAENVKFTVTTEKKPQKAVAGDVPRYIVADFTNNAAGPIVVSWELDGEKKTREVKPGETVQQELVFTDGNPKREVTFTAVRKDNNEPVKLNGAENVKFTVTPDKKAQKAIGSDVPRYIVAEFTNNAAGPIIVSWEQDGKKETRDVKPGETVTQELVFIDGDAKQQVTFSAVRKDNNEPVKLNGAENVKFTVTRDKKAQKAIASDIPRYIVAEFTNNAAGPIIVSWELDGEKKTRDVKPGETVKQELVFIDGDSKQQVTFNAVRKENNEPVTLNGAENVKFTASPDKKPQKAVAGDVPRYIVADFTNNAAGPIVVSWEHDGAKKTREVKLGETVQQELLFIDGDAKRQVTFSAVRKDNNEPVTLNGAENVKFTVTTEKKPQKAVAGDVPRYIVADFTNNAAGPIVVSWELDGEKKTREVKPGETVQQELVFTDGNPKREVTFTAVRKDNNEPVKLNGAENVKFTVTPDKKAQKAIGSDVPRYIVAEFTNNAAGPIIVSWEQDGKKETRDVKPGETVTQELVFIDGDAKQQVTFSAVRKDNNEPVKLNGAENVKFTVTRDKKAQKAIASDIPRYIVAEFTNNAAGPIIVSWELDGEKKTRDVKPGETVKQELVFIDGDSKQQVTFNAVRKENNEPVTLNGAENVKFTASPDKKPQKAVAGDVPRYIVADFTNNAAGPIVVSFEQDGEKRRTEVMAGETVQQELVFIDGNPKMSVTFTARRKDNNQPVNLNGAENVRFTVTAAKKAQKAVASDIPRYIIADFTNNAAGPIMASWEQDGATKTKDIKRGETSREELVFFDGDPKREVTFMAVNKNNNKAVRLNDAENVTFTVTTDKTPQKAVATNPKLYTIVEFINQAAGPVDVSWSVSGVKRSLSVPLGKTLREKLIFNDGLYSRKVVFSGSRKNSGDAVMLNNLEKASVPVRDDQSVRSIVLTDYPRYVSVDIANNADSAILVSWLEGGSSRSLVIEPSRSAQREIVFKNADVSSPVTFSGKLKDSDQDVKLNGLPSVTVLPTATKAVSEVIATNVPVTINIEFVNKALGPIVFSWLENGVPKTLDVEMNGSKKKSITLKGLAAEMPLVFTGARKYFDFSVKVNNAESVQYTALADKGNQRIVASDQMLLMPFFDEGWKSAADVGTRRYLIVDVINKASGPIRFISSRDGQEKFVKLPGGETKRIALVFQGLDDAKPVLFYGKRLDFGIPVRVNDGKIVELRPTLDKNKVNKIVVTDERLVMPWLQPAGLISPGAITSPGNMRYVTVDLVNQAQGPIIISTSRGSRKQDFSLSPGETKKTTFVLNGQNDKPVLFVGRRADTEAPVSLNYNQEVLFIPRTEKVTETVIARDQPKYVAVDFINDAGGPVTISWVLDGRKDSLELAPKKSTLKQLNPSFKTKNVVFTAARTDIGVPVKLNKADSVTFVPTYDRSIETVTATDSPQYIVADLINKADGPAEFSWIENGETITQIVSKGRNVQRTIIFKYVTGKQQVSFTAKRKDLNFPILVNDVKSVQIAPSFEKIVKKVVATDIKLILPWFDEGWKSVTDVGIRRYLEVDMKNNAFGPIVVTATRGDVKKTVDVAAGKTSSVAMIFQGPRSADPVTFKATRKDNGAVVHLNGATSVQFNPRFERFTENVVAVDAPKYLSVDITNNAFGPITVLWLQNGVQASAEVRPGKTVRRDMVFKGANSDKPVVFTGVISGTKDSIILNDGSNVKFTPSYDRTAKPIVAKSKDVSRYLVINFNNQGSGPGVVSWLENGGTQRSLEIPKGQTLRRELVFSNGDAFKKIKFTAKRRDNNDPMRLNDVREFQLVPSTNKNPEQVVLTDSPRYLDILFRNNAPGTIYISWLQGGLKRQLTMQKGQSVPLSLVLPAQERNMPFVFSSKFVSLPGIVYLNNLSPISYAPSFVRSQPHVVTATSPHVDVNFINTAQRPATVKWIELETPKQLTIPAGKAVRRLIFFESSKDSIVLTGSLESNGKKFVAQLNSVDSLKMQEDATNLRRNVRIREGMEQFEL